MGRQMLFKRCENGKLYFKECSSQKNLVFTKSERDKKFVLQRFFKLHCVVCAGKKAQKLLVDIQVAYISYRNVVHNSIF